MAQDDLSARALIVGAGTGGLVTAVELVRAGLCVDVLDVHEAFGAGQQALRGAEAGSDERALTARFVREVLGGGPLDADGPGADLHSRLLALARGLPASQLRFLRGTEALRLLRGKGGAVLGVRARTMRGGRAVSESNLFADAVVVAAGAPALLERAGGGRCDRQRRAIGADGGVVPGLFVYADAGRGTAHSVASGLRLAAAVADVRAAHVAAGGVPQHRAYYDEGGVLHDTALRPDGWTALRLANRIQLTKYNHLFRFALPRETDQAGLFAGQYLAVRAQPPGAEKPIVRYYSPVSRNSEYGRVDLLVKITDGGAAAPPAASMQAYLQALRPGDTLEFSAPKGGLAYHRNVYSAVGMVAGGTGITPMMQILRSVANHAEDRTPVSLVYGSQTEDDVLCREELLYYSATRKNLSVHVTLEQPPPHWQLGTGMITAATLREHLPPPGKGVVVLLCGPPPMIKAVRGMLSELGYDESMLYDFLRPPRARRNHAARDDSLLAAAAASATGTYAPRARL